MKRKGKRVRRQLAIIRVLPRPLARSQGWLIAGPLRLPCALGRAGVTHDKREGDGATPIGRFRLGTLHYRADRGPRPRTGLAVRPIRPDDGWCDDPRDRRYNRPVKLPCAASHEDMWREDGLYDCVVEIGWNQRPIRRGRGSAIFLHIARPGFQPTEGCVALRPADMRKVLTRVGRGTEIVVG